MYNKKVHEKIVRIGNFLIMDKKKLDRIGELYRKSKSTGLNAEEKAEQESLRREYLDAVKRNFRNTLDSIEYTD